MKKILLFISFLSVLSLNSAFAIFRPVSGIESSDARRVAISRFDPNFIYVGTRNSLYRSQDNGKTFERIAVYNDEEINTIFFDNQLDGIAYVATTRRLYKVTDNIEKIFTVPEEELIIHAAQYKGNIYLATNKGIRFTSQETLVWHRSKILSDFGIYYIEPADDGLYVACERGLYFLKSENKVDKLFITRSRESDGTEEGEYNFFVRVVKVDIFDKKRIWMGTSQGLFVSENKGRSWRKLYLTSITNLFINCLNQTRLQKDTIYIGSTKGFFSVNFKKNTSKQIFEGLSSTLVNWIAFDKKGNIYLATGKGLSRNSYFNSPRQKSEFQIILNDGPPINEIQETAMRYNEVHPDKIKRWRTALKYRAVLPDISLDYDKTVTTALGASYDRVQVGPQDWGINLKWDLGDLIWNTYEDDVDTRSRLNTQLRLDILDEINRVYFERLRLSEELRNNALAKKDVFAKRVRLGELTAILDGYTGGYFSRKLRELNEGQ